MGEYRPAAICRRGHVYSEDLTLTPSAGRCSTCGAKIITACSSCNSIIRGYYHVPGVADFGSDYKPPDFCHDCGQPHSWASRQARIWELQNLLDEEDLGEAERLTVSEQLDALLDPDLSEEEQVERWGRVRKMAPGLMSSGQKIVESVMTAAIKAQLGF